MPAGSKRQLLRLSKGIMWCTLCLLPCLSLTGCFTGVESTPKITAKEVKKQHIVATAEQTFLADLAGEPFAQWQKGKTLWVTDGKLELVLTPQAGATQPARGMIITFEGREPAVTVTGDKAYDINLRLPDGSLRQYRVKESSLAAADEGDKAPLAIPFTIEMSLLEKVASRLDSHRRLYITTPAWYTPVGEPRNGLKYVPVHIESIEPGTHVYPVKVIFTHDHDTASVFMNVGPGGGVRTFDTLFAFDDPHKRYLAITDATWDNIIHGYISRDMTRDEVRLAIGRPTRLDRIPTTDGLEERWQYDDGTYLIFDSQGLLINLMRR